MRTIVTLTVSAVTLASTLVCLTGCNHQNRAATAPPPPAVPVQQQIQQIQSNPNLPPQVKAIQMQHARDSAGPAASQTAQPPTR